MADATKPSPLHPGIDRALIETLVQDFYGRVRGDPELGPIFERVVTDWPPHLETMVDFWSAVTKVTRRFDGRPMQKHLAIAEIEPRHFDRWLALFRVSVRSVTPPAIAEIFINRAERIAQSLQQGIAFARARSL